MERFPSEYFMPVKNKGGHLASFEQMWDVLVSSLDDSVLFLIFSRPCIRSDTKEKLSKGMWAEQINMYLEERNGVSVSCSCCNNLPPTWKVKGTQIYSFTFWWLEDWHGSQCT